MAAAPMASTPAVGLYRFALRDWEREIADGFPLLRRITGDAGRLLLALMQGLTAGEQRDLAAALVQRFHPQAVAALHVERSAEQERLLSRWDAWRVSAADGAGAGARRAAAAVRKRLRAAVKERLSFLGQARALDGPDLWRYRTAVGTWSVATVVDLGGRSDDVSYDHDLVAPDEVPLLRRVSFLSWLGAGPTKWRVVGDDVDAAADTLADLCRRFLAAVASLAGDDDRV